MNDTKLPEIVKSATAARGLQRKAIARAGVDAMKPLDTLETVIRLHNLLYPFSTLKALLQFAETYGPGMTLKDARGAPFYELNGAFAATVQGVLAGCGSGGQRR
jgi:hypothetical protein